MAQPCYVPPLEQTTFNYSSFLYSLVQMLNGEGKTPLYIAVSCTQDYSVSRVLIENGADIMNRSVDGRTSLHTFFNAVVAAVLQRHGDSIDEEVSDK
jgi:hypothetical protein